MLFRRVLSDPLRFFTTIFIAAATINVASSAFSYSKATEGSAVVLRKIFPKKKKVELNANAGVILNSSYLDTFLVNAGINYYFSEVWGFGGEVTFASNSDKPERSCIETFYNDPDDAVGDECGGPEPLKDRANFGPAYVPIIEIKQMVAGNIIWNPVYGKQLFMLSATSYFDIFVIMGGGMAFADFYEKTNTLRDGTTSRGQFRSLDDPDPRPDNIGTLDESLTGVDGRPDPQSVSYPLVNFGTGMKYHFFKRFSVKIELRNYTLLGTESGFDNFFTLWGGLGVRF